jgi:hypothetical protein
MTHNIATLISYSSNDLPFLKHCLFEAKKFSKKIIVTASDHLFDGTEENIKNLLITFSLFDFAHFIIYPFVPEKIPKRIYKKTPSPYLWHDLSRLASFCQLDKSIEYVLFLDVDEIVDGDRFKTWLDTNEYRSFDAIRPSNYWYFRTPHFQATTFEDTSVLAKKSSLSYKSLLHPLERDAIFDSVKGPKKRNVMGLDSLPMIHHYSWVRTKDQMLKKVNTWGHKNDRNWNELVEKEFDKDFTFKDFVHGYDFIKIKPFVEIDLNEKIIGFHGQQSNTVFLKSSNIIKMLKKRSLKDYLLCSLDLFSS